MSRKYLIVIPILILVVALSSCFFFQADSPPVSLYWHFKDTGLANAYFAYDPDSDILFIRGDSEGTLSVESTPPYVNSAIAAVSIKDKQVLWRKVYPAILGNGKWVEVYNGKVYLLECGTERNPSGLVALDEKTGEQIWKVPFENRWIFNGFTISEGYVYTFGGGHYDPTSIYKINAENGEIEWEVPIQGAFDTCPVVDEEYGHVYFGTSTSPDSETEPRYFYALNTADGSIAWEVTIDATPGLIDNFGSIPVIDIDGDSVYAGTWFGKIIRFDRRTGEKIWEERLMDKEGMHCEPGWGGRFWVYKDKLLMVLTRGIILALNTKDGSVAWQKDVSITLCALHDLYLDKGRIYVHGYASNIGCFSAEDGKKLWIYAPPDSDYRVSGTPMVIGDYLVDTTQYGDVYVIKLNEK